MTRKLKISLSLENPLDDPITSVPVIESEEFYSVFESKIGNISLLYNAEMDGLDSRVEVDLTKSDFDKLNFVEVKTCVDSNTKGRCRWWAQSLLARVSNIMIGHRTLNGIVYKIDSVPVHMLANRTEVIFIFMMCH